MHNRIKITFTKTYQHFPMLGQKWKEYNLDGWHVTHWPWLHQGKLEKWWWCQSIICDNIERVYIHDAWHLAHSYSTLLLLKPKLVGQKYQSIWNYSYFSWFLLTVGRNRNLKIGVPFNKESSQEMWISLETLVGCEQISGKLLYGMKYLNLWHILTLLFFQSEQCLHSFSSSISTILHTKSPI